MSTSSGPRLADHGRAGGLDDARLLRRDVGERRAGELGVVHADVRDDRDLRLDHVRRVPAAEQTDLDDGDVDRDVGEPSERRGRHRLEVGRAYADQRFEVGDRRHLFGEVVVTDRLAVATRAAR